MDLIARGFLARQRVAHLATADTNGQPHVIPVCFVILDESIYIVIDEKPKRGSPLQLRRVRNVLENPRVAFVADEYDDADWSRLGFVLVRGAARVLELGEEHATALSALRRKYVQYQTMQLDARPVIAIDVDSVVAWGTAHAH